MWWIATYFLVAVAVFAWKYQQADEATRVCGLDRLGILSLGWIITIPISWFLIGIANLSDWMERNND